ncbi:hypothetical protein MLD38_024841 [Melastoma candidum]|uniref:Uncharacterized protein n=1 Tax=Melastoma candidum TaxID=119954 RepID=A0ACB9NTH9_9MYRT|nr:hypothetical protein MLD38_024841 [Melastoma candidum]
MQHRRPPPREPSFGALPSASTIDVPTTLIAFPKLTTEKGYAYVRGSLLIDVAVFVIWELVTLAFLVFSAISLYFRHMRLASILICVALLLLLCMKGTKHVKLVNKKKRRMFFPLSM